MKEHERHAIPHIEGYEFIRLLGEGGMAKVYLVRNEIGEEYALKILSSRPKRFEVHLRRFHKEASLVSAMRHPNIVRVYDHGVVEHTYSILMEYIKGFDLRSLVDRKNKRGIPPELALRYIYQVAKAISYAHDLGTIHRDIKPGNVLVEKDTGRAVLTDFGVAKLMENDWDLTATGMAVGTPGYMSPEQTMGEELDVRSDIYAVGVMYYELMTGTLPYPPIKNMSQHRLRLSEKPPKLPSSHDRYQYLVSNMIVADREARFENARELVEAIEHHLDDKTIQMIDQIGRSGELGVENLLSQGQESEYGEKARVQADSPVGDPTKDESLAAHQNTPKAKIVQAKKARERALAKVALGANEPSAQHDHSYEFTEAAPLTTEEPSFTKEMIHRFKKLRIRHYLVAFIFLILLPLTTYFVVHRHKDSSSYFGVRTTNSQLASLLQKADDLYQKGQIIPPATPNAYDFLRSQEARFLQLGDNEQAVLMITYLKRMLREAISKDTATERYNALPPNKVTEKLRYYNAISPRVGGALTKEMLVEFETKWIAMRRPLEAALLDEQLSIPKRRKNNAALLAHYQSASQFFSAIATIYITKDRAEKAPNPALPYLARLAKQGEEDSYQLAFSLDFQSATLLLHHTITLWRSLQKTARADSLLTQIHSWEQRLPMQHITDFAGEMVALGGCFQSRFQSEQICLKPFYMSKEKVRWYLLEPFLESQKDLFPKKDPLANREAVGWNYQEANAFIDWLNRQVTGGRFRLPTAMEWEYAALGGVDAHPAPLRCRDCQKDRLPLSESLHTEPNDFNLAGLSSNLWEMTSTNEDAQHYIVMGGSFHSRKSLLSNLVRFQLKKSARADDLGFRLVWEPSSPPPSSPPSSLSSL